MINSNAPISALDDKTKIPPRRERGILDKHGILDELQVFIVRVLIDQEHAPVELLERLVSEHAAERVEFQHGNAGNGAVLVLYPRKTSDHCYCSSSTETNRTKQSKAKLKHTLPVVICCPGPTAQTL